jgi:hypothetical protein
MHANVHIEKADAPSECNAGTIFRLLEGLLGRAQLFHPLNYYDPFNPSDARHLPIRLDVFLFAPFVARNANAVCTGRSILALSPYAYLSSLRLIIIPALLQYIYLHIYIYI